jgi:hypothetical protein
LKRASRARCARGCSTRAAECHRRCSRSRRRTWRAIRLRGRRAGAWSAAGAGLIQATYEQLATKVIRTNEEAKGLLAKLTTERDALQTQLTAAHAAQEKKDADNAKTIAAQDARLRGPAASAPGGQLRDPNAGAGDCRAGPKGDAAADAGSGQEHPPEAGGLLSGQLSGLLRKLTREADGINAAYESARADALMCRQAAGATP